MQSGAIQLMKNNFDALSQRTADEDTMKPLEYARRENFQTAVYRPIESFKTTGCAVEEHFRGVTKMVEIGKGGNGLSMTFCPP